MPTYPEFTHADGQKVTFRTVFQASKSSTRGDLKEIHYF
jgi:hypothetical protein